MNPNLTKARRRELRTKSQLSPLWHITDIQGSRLVAAQSAVVRSIAEHERVAIKAPHGVGKTYIASKIVLWFLPSFPRSRVITTAPTGRQVRELLWQEIRAGHARSRYPLGGTPLVSEWSLGDKWKAIGFSTRKEAGQGDAASNFQGWHARYVLVIFDEATGIDAPLWDRVETMFTGRFIRFVAIGNPTTKASRFFSCFNSRLWRHHTISCFDSPNLPANGVTNRDELIAEIERCRELPVDELEARLRSYKVAHQDLVTLKWCVERGLEWGTDTPIFVSRVLGEFPEDAENCIATLGQVEIAINRERADGSNARRSWGVDPAHSLNPKADDSSIAMFEGPNQVRRWSLHGQDTGEVAGFVTARSNEMSPREEEIVMIDGTGIGAGVYDNLKRNYEAGILRAVPVLVHFGQGAGLDWELKADHDEAERRFANVKARMYKLLSDDIKSTVALLDFDVYRAQLPTILYSDDARGRLKIESKDDYRLRTGLKSPDDSDAIALANFGRRIPMPRTSSPPRAYWL